MRGAGQWAVAVCRCVFAGGQQRRHHPCADDAGLGSCGQRAVGVCAQPGAKDTSEASTRPNGREQAYAAAQLTSQLCCFGQGPASVSSGVFHSTYTWHQAHAEVVSLNTKHALDPGRMSVVTTTINDHTWWRTDRISWLTASLKRTCPSCATPAAIQTLPLKLPPSVAALDEALGVWALEVAADLEALQLLACVRRNDAQVALFAAGSMGFRAHTDTRALTCVRRACNTPH